jgi:hypothetical protein
MPDFIAYPIYHLLVTAIHPVAGPLLSASLILLVVALERRGY